MDMATTDTTKTITRAYIFQVISSTNSYMYYFTIKNRITTHTSTICRIVTCTNPVSKYEQAKIRKKEVGSSSTNTPIVPHTR